MTMMRAVIIHPGTHRSIETSLQEHREGKKMVDHLEGKWLRVDTEQLGEGDKMCVPSYNLKYFIQLDFIMTWVLYSTDKKE